MITIQCSLNIPLIIFFNIDVTGLFVICVLMPEHKKGLQAIPAEKGKSMAREKKTKTNDLQKPVSVDVSKLTQGISLVFTGAIKMLEAIESANVSIALNPVNTSVLSETGRETITEKTDDTTGEHNAATGGEADEPVTVHVPQKKPTADANAGQKKTDKMPEEKPQKSGSTARPITTDDITKIIVRKIKQNKANNERIGLVLKTYGVERVSDLKPEQYEAFITDLAAL